MNQLTVSLWGDEAWAATLIRKNIPDIIAFVSRDTSPPFYYLFTHLWTRLFGLSEIGLRSSSLFFWFLTALFTALIAHHFWKNKLATTLAFLLTLANPFLFQYAFEARMYACLAAMSTIATYFFLKKNRPAYIITAALSLYTHHFSLFVIFVHFLSALLPVLKKPKKLKTALSPFFFIGLLYLPWLPPMYRQITMVKDQGFWLGRPQPQHLLELLLKFFAGLNQHPLQFWIILAGLAVLIIRRWSKKDSKTNFLLAWLFLPAILVFLFSQFFQPIFYDRYLINLIPALVLLLISLTRSCFSYFFLIPLLLFTLILDIWFFQNPDKRPFRQLAAHIRSTRKPGDVLINWAGKSHHLFESKYYQVYAPIYTPSGPLPFYTGTALMEPQDQIQTLPPSPRLGLITSDSLDQINLPNYVKIKQDYFADLSISWWTKTDDQI